MGGDENRWVEDGENLSKEKSRDRHITLTGMLPETVSSVPLGFFD